MLHEYHNISALRKCLLLSQAKKEKCTAFLKKRRKREIIIKVILMIILQPSLMRFKLLLFRSGQTLITELTPDESIQDLIVMGKSNLSLQG